MRARSGFLSIFGVVGVVMAVAASASAAQSQTIHFLEVNTSFAGTGGWNVTSNEPPAIGQGFTFTSTLFKWAGTKKGAPLGHDQVLCTETSQAEQSVEFQCAATVFLPGGALQLAGPTNFESSVTNVAVVGGTGKYAGARGTARIRNIGGGDSNSSAYVIHLMS